MGDIWEISQGGGGGGGVRELLDFKGVKGLDSGWILPILGSKSEKLTGGRVSFLQSSEEFVTQSAFYPYSRSLAIFKLIHKNKCAHIFKIICVIFIKSSQIISFTNI